MYQHSRDAADDEPTMTDMRGVLPGQRPPVDATVLDEPTSEVPVIRPASSPEPAPAAGASPEPEYESDPETIVAFRPTATPEAPTAPTAEAGEAAEAAAVSAPADPWAEPEAVAGSPGGPRAAAEPEPPAVAEVEVEAAAGLGSAPDLGSAPEGTAGSEPQPVPEPEPGEVAAEDLEETVDVETGVEAEEDTTAEGEVEMEAAEAPAAPVAAAVRDTPAWPPAPAKRDLEPAPEMVVEAADAVETAAEAEPRIDAPVAAATEPVAAGAEASAPGKAGATPIALWSSDAADRLHSQWRDLQVQFFEDPEVAVAGAKSLVSGAVRELADTLLAAQDELDPYRDAERVDTEAMRLAMRRYREFLDRVLAL
jgi:hypothetical protein